METIQPQIFQQTEKLKLIYTRLLSIHCTESAVTEIERLFFEVLAMCRNYNGIAEYFVLLSKLRLIQENEYVVVQNKNLTIKNKLLAIKRFKNAFRLAILKAFKKPGKKLVFN